MFLVDVLRGLWAWMDLVIFLTGCSLGCCCWIKYIMVIDRVRMKWRYF